MKVRMRFSWFLPAFHLAMDAILVGMLVGETPGNTEHSARRRGLRSVAFVQEDPPGFRFDVRVNENSFEVLVSSTLPAALLSLWEMDDKSKVID